MSESNLKAPTRKAFHFPKGEAAETSPVSAEAAASTDSVASADSGAATSTSGSAKRARAAATKASAETHVAAAESAAVKPTAAKKPRASAGGTKPSSKPAANGKTAATKAAAKTPTTKKASVKKAPVSKPEADASASTDVPKGDVTASEKPKRDKKEKVVRDSFTMPKSDYAKIAALKQKCLEAGVHVKKSELLRAGLALLEAAPAKRLVAAVADLEAVKTGRPAND